ncbi:MAG: sigma-70 family RNA polymerase sigma factor [Prevotella sp.]|nr:sigma-70 family RNA polymerase sigma factor [Prevotella sp.]
MHEELHSPIVSLARALVRNISLDHLRQTRPAVSLAESDIEDADAGLTDHGRIERLMQVVGSLPTSQQIILRLRHMDRMEYSDIALLTGSTEGAVRQSLCRARKTVRSRYEQKKQAYEDE